MTITPEQIKKRFPPVSSSLEFARSYLGQDAKLSTCKRYLEKVLDLSINRATHWGDALERTPPAHLVTLGYAMGLPDPLKVDLITPEDFFKEIVIYDRQSQIFWEQHQSNLERNLMRFLSGILDVSTEEIIKKKEWGRFPTLENIPHRRLRTLQLLGQNIKNIKAQKLHSRIVA